jgi:hypothetical protein
MEASENSNFKRREELEQKQQSLATLLNTHARKEMEHTDPIV